MIAVFLIWLFVFFLCFVPGFYLMKAADRVEQRKVIRPDECFFMGLLAISVIAGLLSLVIAVGNQVLLGLAVVGVILFLVKFRQITIVFKRQVNYISELSLTGKVIIILPTVFMLTAAASAVTLYDAGLYHTQSIQWIRNYPVVPGLGNLHGRFAFNSLFFVISALFTFQIKDILIFPLNGLCLLVVLLRLFTMIIKETGRGAEWKVLLYGIMALAGLFIMLPDINSASPDIICGLLIIYTIALMIDRGEQENEPRNGWILLINLLIFSCISFKLSASLLVLFIIITLRKDFPRRLIISSLVLILIFSAFFIRNYYLSGYLVYPFPGIDLFSPDWKIPAENVLIEKLSVESWARIPGMPYDEVQGMNIGGWIKPWFRSLNLNSIFLIIPNLFSLFVLVLMFIRKDYFIASIQLIILLNLIFWFSLAPDPRFAYGCLIAGAAVTLTYPFRYFELTRKFINFKYYGFFLIILFVLVLFQRRAFPVEMISDPDAIIIPDKYESVETQIQTAGFSYRVPVTGDQCFNSDLPCVPWPLDNVILRGEGIKDGFKVVSAPQPYK
jgi:hypothetical protein